MHFFNMMNAFVCQRSGEVQLAVMFAVFGTNVSAALLFSVLPPVWSGPVLLVVAAMHQNRVFLRWRFFHQQSLENAFVWALLPEIILIHLQLTKRTGHHHLTDIRFDTVYMRSWYLLMFLHYIQKLYCKYLFN